WFQSRHAQFISGYMLGKSTNITVVWGFQRSNQDLNIKPASYIHNHLMDVPITAISTPLSMIAPPPDSKKLVISSLDCQVGNTVISWYATDRRSTAPQFPADPSPFGIREKHE